MWAQNADVPGRKYDRAFPLSEEKRNQVLELWEVQKFGPPPVSAIPNMCVYGMSPTEWYRRGVRLLARTTVEAARDKLGTMAGKGVESVIRKAAPPTARFGIIDPFAGSCNALFGYCVMRGTRRDSVSRSTRRSSQWSNGTSRPTDRASELINGVTAHWSARFDSPLVGAPSGSSARYPSASAARGVP